MEMTTLLLVSGTALVSLFLSGLRGKVMIPLLHRSIKRIHINM